MNSIWTIEEGHEFDAETFETYQAWHVVDGDGEPVHTFRNREDAEEWLAEQSADEREIDEDELLEAWAEQEAEAMAERRAER